MHSARRAALLSVLAAAALVGLLYWKPAGPSRPRRVAPLTVYCAAGLKPAVEPVARDYERRYGVGIQLQYGGSGTLLSNLRLAGAGDLFLAADSSYLDLARSNQLLAEIIPLAKLTPVIAVPRGNPKQVRGLADLRRADVAVALANPDAAAVGRVARERLQQSGDWTALAPRVKVFKPTVGDVANDIKIGAVDAGIVWDAVARQYPELEMVRPPALDTARQEVAVGVLRATRQPTAALHFARFLGARDRGLLEFARAGYEVLEGDVWADQPEVVLFSGGVNRPAIEETLRRFEEREGVKITRVYNGCGILVAQMKAGQRPDAYFACDVSFVPPVQDWFTDGVNVSETDIILLVPKGNPKGLRALADLARPGLRLGVANAQQSTLGALTERFLRDAGLLESVMANVKTQTPTADLLVNQMRTGALDAVIVYTANTSQVRDTLDVVPLKVPGARAVQPYAIGKNSQHRFLMGRLLETLRSAESRKQFESLGFRWQATAEQP